MARVARLSGLAIVLVTSLVTAVSADERGAVFWASTALVPIAAFALWRVWHERAP